MQTKFDVVIIGSGAGGAPIAHTLTKAGKSVLVLEKGPHFRPQTAPPASRRPGFPPAGQPDARLEARSDFRRDELFSDGPEKRIQIPGVRNNGSSYYSSHVEPDLNDEPHIYRDADGSDKATLEGYTAQLVGGGTQLYGGVSFRFSPLDFRLASFNAGRNDLKADPNGDIQREARDWPISYDDLEPYYYKTEQTIGINGTVANQQKPFKGRDAYQTPLAPNPISAAAKRGMELMAEGLKNELSLPAAIPPLPHPARGHHSRSRPQRSPGPGRPGPDQDQLREPFRRPAGVQVKHLGFPACAHRQRAELHPALQLHCDPAQLCERAC